MATEGRLSASAARGCSSGPVATLAGLIPEGQTDLSVPGAAVLYGAGALDALLQRWRALDRDARIALTGLTALCAGAVAVRIWFMASYRPAFLGFNDSYQYVLSAARNIFSAPQWPAGYPFFLRLVHHLSDRLSFTILVQHGMGIASGLLLYKSVRRLAVPPWLGLLPAALVFFSGTGLFLEHSLLADPVLNFLQALAVYFAVRSLEGSDVRWPILAGAAIGVGFWAKTSAISTAVAVSAVLLFAVPGELRRRALLASSALATVAVAIFIYVGAQAYFTGWWGYERQDAWNLYARVSSFVDCRNFTPPKGTAFLCPTEAVSHRLPPAFYQYSRISPAVKRYGVPNRAPRSANAVLRRFAVSAIVNEPLAYAGTILNGLTFYVFPRQGEAYTPGTIRSALEEQREENSIEPAVALLYPHSVGYYRRASSVRALNWYESHTRIEGAVMILLLVAAAASPLVLRGRTRSAAILFGLTALFSATLAVAGAQYDARYAYVTFGPLGAAAALGAWGAFTNAHLRRAARRLISGALRGGRSP